MQLLRLVGAAPVIAVEPLVVARERALTLGADAARARPRPARPPNIVL
ncbi:hypothetical protein [Micromonospora sp. CA-111912]